MQPGVAHAAVGAVSSQLDMHLESCAAGVQGRAWQPSQAGSGRYVPGYPQAGVLWPVGAQWSRQNHHHEGKPSPVARALLWWGNVALQLQTQ